MSWNKAKILKVVNFPAQAEHNKAVNLPLEYAWLFFSFFFQQPPTAGAGNGDVSERIIFSNILC